MINKKILILLSLIYGASYAFAVEKSHNNTPGTEADENEIIEEVAQAQQQWEQEIQQIEQRQEEELELIRRCNEQEPANREQIRQQYIGILGQAMQLPEQERLRQYIERNIQRIEGQAQTQTQNQEEFMRNIKHLHKEEREILQQNPGGRYAVFKKNMRNRLRAMIANAVESKQSSIGDWLEAEQERIERFRHGIEQALIQQQVRWIQQGHQSEQDMQQGRGS